MLHSIFLDQPIDEALVSELIDGGWWKRDGDYIVVQAYTKHNPSAEELEDSAASARNRKAEYRSRAATQAKNANDENENAVPDLSHGTTPDNENIVPRDNALRQRLRVREDLDRDLDQNTYAGVREAEPVKTKPAPKAPEPDWFSTDSVATVFGEEREAAGGMPYTQQHSQYRGLEDAVTVFVECAKRLKIPPIEAARRSARNFCASDWAKENKFPVAVWLKDPAKNLTETKPKEALPWIARNVG
ncbi:MAG: hypothetical protein IPK60_22915 [Sandaracinaceae bacterium]|nr:hypothetical protein [Sandaracinaceae bacterium]